MAKLYPAWLTTAPSIEPVFCLQTKNSLLAMNIKNTHNKDGRSRKLHLPEI